MLLQRRLRASPTSIVAICLAAALLVAGGIALMFANAAADGLNSARVVTDDGAHSFQIEIADDMGERSRGLMFRRSLGQNQGMLFDFREERPVSMWMKNTYLPLDMLFIGADGTIREIAENTTPLSERTVSSGVPVRYVLEINAGRAAALGIEEGDRVEGQWLAEKGGS